VKFSTEHIHMMELKVFMSFMKTDEVKVMLYFWAHEFLSILSKFFWIWLHLSTGDIHKFFFV
jgi:hypothetical protein